MFILSLNWTTIVGRLGTSLSPSSGSVVMTAGLVESR